MALIEAFLAKLNPDRKNALAAREARRARKRPRGHIRRAFLLAKLNPDRSRTP